MGIPTHRRRQSIALVLYPVKESFVSQALTNQ